MSAQRRGEGLGEAAARGRLMARTDVAGEQSPDHLLDQGLPQAVPLRDDASATRSETHKLRSAEGFLSRTWYSGSTRTSQMVAWKAWSPVARARPT